MKMISLMQIMLAMLWLGAVMGSFNLVIHHKQQQQQQYNSGYEQGVFDSYTYANRQRGERGLLSAGFRAYLQKTKPNLQTTEEMWNLEDEYLESCGEFVGFKK